MKTTTRYLISGANRAVVTATSEISMALSPHNSPAEMMARIAEALNEMDIAVNAMRDAILTDDVGA